MASKSGREALRGAEVHTLDLIFKALTAEQWAELLQAPLERAVAMGNRDLAQRLVRAGAEIGTALHEAIEGGHGEIVSDMLESGASLVAKDANGYTPLQVAALEDQSEIVRLLLLKGAGKAGPKGLTPLYFAAMYGHLDVILALLAAGADVNLGAGVFKKPAIQVAAQTGHVEIVWALIERGANVNAAGSDKDTALHSAASNNHVKAIDVLVEAGANIEARDKNGRTPLHCASVGLFRAAILCLLKHGANVNTQEDMLLRTPFEHVLLRTPLICAAVQAGRQGAVEVVDSLLRAGADENIVDGEGRKAADVVGQHAGGEEDIERVRELLANAPADRAWRRRGYLVLYRAHPDRVKENQVISGTHHVNTGQIEASDCHEAVGDSHVHGRTGVDWAVVVSKVLLLREEGVFRRIVGYL